MPNFYQLLLVTLLPITLTAGCSECFNGKYEPSIFDQLRDDGDLADVDNEDPNNSSRSRRNGTRDGGRSNPRPRQSLSSEVNKFFKDPDNQQLDSYGRTTIRLDRLKDFLNSSVNLTSIDGSGRNILHEALHTTNSHDFEAIKCIVEKLKERYPQQLKRLLNQEDYRDNTPFIEAVKGNNTELVEYLIDHGADPSYEELKHVFTDISKNGHLEMFTYLLDKQASSALNPHIMHKLSVAGKPDLMEYFLENRNVDLSQADKKGNTPLHNTSLTKDEVSARLILKKDCSFINKKNTYGETALHIAIKQESLPLVSTLLRYGADATICDGNGKSPLELAEQNLEAYNKKVQACRGQDDINSLGLEARAILDKVRSRLAKNYTTQEELDSVD